MSDGNRVRILSDALINKIAAGEVVERPASVVKELVENAVDAGAGAVRVDVRGGGRTRIAVRDDGRGMSRDDVLLAIERHATSKIRAPEDLFKIHSLGFRGEALPSIAQVSRMEIRTAERGAEAGTQLLLDGGVLKWVRDAPPVAGTEIEVRRLFFNTPVRLRFLKGERTEIGHVTEAVVRLALANPAVRFELWNGDRARLRAEPTDDPGRRAADLLGRSIRDQLAPVEHTDGDVRLRGLVGRPGLHRSTRNGLYLFVNGRPVRDRLLTGAALSAYRGLVPKGRFPVVTLFLDLPADQVDHNVHPTKNEVRFVQANRVYRLLVDAVGAALRPPARVPTGGVGDDRYPPPARPRRSPTWSQVRESLFDGLSAAPRPGDDGSRPTDHGPRITDHGSRITDHGRRIKDHDPRPANDDHARAPAHAPSARTSDHARTPRAGFRFTDLTYIGAYEGTYLLCQDRDELVLVDQHAAHERINYEKILRAKDGAVGGGSQALLVPEVIDLPRAHAEMLLGREELLGGLGIEVSDFGGGSIAVTAVPPAIDPGEVRSLICDLAQELADGTPARAVDELRHRLAALAACHASVRAHDRLGADTVRALLLGLDAAEHPYTCPHGRPLLVRFPLREVKGWFERS